MSEIVWPKLDTPDDKKRASELYYVVPMRVTLVTYDRDKKVDPFTREVARLVMPFWQDMILAQLLFRKDDGTKD